MVFFLSLVLVLIFNLIFTRLILVTLSEFVDLSIFNQLSVWESSVIRISLCIIIPMIIIYLVLKKLNIQERLKNTKSVKIILIVISITFVLYIILLALSTTIQGGGITFVIKILFIKYVYPVLVILFLIVLFIIIKELIKSRKNSYEYVSLKAHKKTKFLTIGVFLCLFLVFVNPYGNIIKNIKVNNELKSLFESEKNAALLRNIKSNEQNNENINNFKSIFIENNFGREYCKIDKFGNYSSFSGGQMSFSRFVKDYDLTFEILNDNKKTNGEFKYRQINKFDNAALNKNLQSKYSFVSNQIYSENSIVGTNVKIVELESNKVIAESFYFVSVKTKKVYADDFMFSNEKFGNELCLKPINIINSIIKK